MPNIEDILDSTLLFDGAMGTYYNQIRAAEVAPCEQANLLYPQVIEEIHRQYIKSGARAIRTNTFRSNSGYLGCDLNNIRESVSAGYKIAYRAAKGTDTLIFADIGPIKAETREIELKEYRIIIDTFLKEGANKFLFETFSDYETLLENCRYIKSKDKNAFIMAQFGIMPDGYTRLGISGEQIIEKLSGVSEIGAFGFNCVSGPSHLLSYIKSVNIKEKAISVMPNAGYPVIIEERAFFDISPNYFAQRMMEIKACGVRILGGCCGTTPEHIAALHELLIHEDEKKPSKPAEILHHKSDKIRSLSGLKQKFETGKKIIAVEMSPPLEADAADFMERAKKIKAADADLITVPDCPISRPRADCGLISCKINRELNIDVMPHLTCRDRNINALKALLLGLSIENVDNLLVISGDPIPVSERTNVKGVFEFNSVKLASYINDLNLTVFKDKPFFLSGALNINAINFGIELERAKKKIDSGMTAFFTQPVFTDTAVRNLQRARTELKAGLFAGVMPIVSYKNAQFINNEISGIHVPDEIVERFEGKNREECFEISTDIALELARAVYNYVDGFYLITPLKRTDIICEIIKGIRRIQA